MQKLQTIWSHPKVLQKQISSSETSLYCGKFRSQGRSFIHGYIRTDVQHSKGKQFIMAY
jgi:hypothetical protein